MPSRINRRQLLKGGAAVGLGAGLAGLPTLPAAAVTPAARRAPASLTGSIRDVEHVVFLMMENRSFDQVFGTLSGVRGFDDRTIRRPGGRSIFEQPDPTNAAGYTLPFLLSLNNNGQDNVGLSHDWVPQHASWNAGAMDNWIPAHIASDSAKQGPLTMGYYTRSQIPYHYALADAFTVCDSYHCSVMGPTLPNRFMWQTGSIDPDGLGGGPVLTTDETMFADAIAGNGFTFETYPERLQRAGVDWRCYTDQANNAVWGNVLAAFRQYQDPTTDLYARGMSVSLHQFFLDAAQGTLPQVSWIFPIKGHSEHPNDGSINSGPVFYHPIIDALMNGPKWANTVLFLTWDENDGSFDHVPPPTPPPHTKGEWLTHAAFGSAPASTGPTGPTAAVDPSGGVEGPVGLGFRVPLVIVSPFARGGYVCSETFDHTSSLLFLERRFGVEVANLSAWRRSVVGDLTSAFDFTAPDLTIPDLTVPFAEAAAVEYPASTSEKVPTTQVMPTQEPGNRPRRGPTPPWANGPGTDLAESATPAALAATGIAAATAGIVVRRALMSGSATKIDNDLISDGGGDCPAVHDR